MLKFHLRLGLVGLKIWVQIWCFDKIFISKRVHHWCFEISRLIHLRNMSILRFFKRAYWHPFGRLGKAINCNFNSTNRSLSNDRKDNHPEEFCQELFVAAWSPSIHSCGSCRLDDQHLFSHHLAAKHLSGNQTTLFCSKVVQFSRTPLFITFKRSCVEFQTSRARGFCPTWMQ